MGKLAFCLCRGAAVEGEVSVGAGKEDEEEGGGTGDVASEFEASVQSSLTT